MTSEKEGADRRYRAAMAASTSRAPPYAHPGRAMLLQGDQTGITPSIARDPSKAKDMDTVAKLLAVTRLMGLMVTGPPSEDDPLFVSHRGQIIHLPSKMAEAESYVLEKGAKAKASEASERGITAGCLSSVVLKLLNDLDDVLCTGKVYAAFMAAVRITGYRERLYVMRLLLERVPADRMETLKNLVGVVANATSVEDGANAGRRRRIAGLPHARARATGHAEARRAHADVPRHEPDEAHTREGRRRRHRRGEGPRPVPNLREGARVPHLQGRRHLRDRHRGVREEPESRAGSRARVAERVEREPGWAKKSKRHPFARYAAAFEDDGRQRAGDRDDERAGGSRDGGEAR